MEDSTVHKRVTDQYSRTELESDGFLPISQQDIDNEKQFIPKANKSNNKGLSKIDRPAFIILVILYLLQGVPVGLAFGSIPFILKTKLSYSQVGIFSLAAYPYSMKLIWSPIVDAVYSNKLGRRRSWIIPIQTISGITLFYLGLIINDLIDNPQDNLSVITFYFFLLVFFCATQDIAVDGWALTCLSPDSLSYASTAQTIGINTGYFLSFTIFLALSSPDFANKYLRSVPLDEGLFTMGGYLKFWGWMYLIVTGLILCVPEDPPHLLQYNQAKLADEKSKFESYYNKSNSQLVNILNNSSNVYLSMYEILKLPNIQTLVIILLIAKFGFQVNEAGTNLKLLEKGLSKEDLSITVLIDFPFEMIFGYYAGRWSTGDKPLKPWLIGFAGRLLAAFLAQLVVFFFPTDKEIGMGYFIIVILQHLLGSFMSTIQFVSLCAFHTKIADPSIGGTYMTTLNTLSNYGGTWPRLIIFYLIDKLTISKCINIGVNRIIELDLMKEHCISEGGKVEILRDGYYYTNFFCIVCGVFILIWVRKKVEYLQALPNSAWKLKR